MDSISQMALGAAVTHAVLGRRIGRRAAVLGAFLGTLPDLDVLVRHADAIDAFTLHRSWSHSLFVLSPASLPVALLARRLIGPGMRRNRGADVAAASFARWWLAVWATLVTHPLLDAFTTYGTQLFWPLPTPPVAIGSIFIIDPLYTLPLLIGLAVALRRSDGGLARANLAGLGTSTAWLLATLVLQQGARHEAQAAFERAGTVPDKLVVLPFPFGLMWRAVALEGDDYAVTWVSLVDGAPASSVERHARGLDAVALDDPAQVARLRWFTQGFTGARRVGDRLVLTDLRIGTAAMPVFAFGIADAVDGAWRRTLAVARPPVVEIGMLGTLAQRSVDADVRLSDGELAGAAPLP